MDYKTLKVVVVVLLLLLLLFDVFDPTCAHLVIVVDKWFLQINILKCLIYVTPGEKHSYLIIECRWHELKSIKPNLKKQPCHRKTWRIIWHMCRLVIKSTSKRWTKNNCPISYSSRVIFFGGFRSLTPTHRGCSTNLPLYKFIVDSY